jgi:23S rRNA pseudouridine2605 synthase
MTKMNADDTIDERNDNGGERIAKAIARAGLASRREAEDWIAAGHVAVNGAVTNSRRSTTPRDRVSVDGDRAGARAHAALPLSRRARPHATP